MKLLIITIHKGSVQNLKNTLDSIDQQCCPPDFNVVVSPFISDEIQCLYSRSYRKFIIGKDKSLYNAMNIGLDFSKNFYTIFINSGDTLFSLESIKFIKNNFNHGVINIYATALKSPNYIFYPKGHFTSHSSFLRPPDPNPILFNEHLLIVADGKWMQRNIGRFSAHYHKQYISLFSLDGISSIPTLYSVTSKLKYHPRESLKEFIKLLIFNLTFKTEIYFILIYFFKYDAKKI
jgi:hypothetical protein